MNTLYGATIRVDATRRPNVELRFDCHRSVIMLSRDEAKELILQLTLALDNVSRQGVLQTARKPRG